MTYREIMNGYGIYQRGGGYGYTIIKRGEPVHFSRNTYPTHYTAEKAAMRYVAARAA